MGKEEILAKTDRLIQKVADDGKGFEERDVVYLLVEAHKIKEREIGREQLRRDFRHLAFFRDWVVHTRMNDANWVTERETLDRPELLIEELVSILESTHSRQLLTDMRESFIESLGRVVHDQEIAPRK